MDGLSIARERIAREADEKTGFLDLGRVGLSELAESCLGCKGCCGSISAHYIWTRT